MISVVIPTLNAENTLPGCLAALVPGAVDGVVREVIIVDGGSSDATALIADDAGARWHICEPGRGQQIARGVGFARSAWLLILHADTVLEAGWADEVSSFIEKVEGGRASSAAVFRHALDDEGARPRLLETLVNARSRLLALPYGDQGLLISRQLYDEIGGFKPLPIMEDVDIVRRLGRGRLTLLRSRAVTSAARYRSDGYFRRIVRNQSCLAMYLAGVPVEKIARFYGGPASSEKAAVPAKPHKANRAATDVKPS